MNLMGRIVLSVALAWVLVVTPVAAQDREVPSALRPYMTAEEFRAAGLHKMNPAELAQFQAWFIRTMRSGGEDPLARVPEARPSAGDSRADELAIERRRLAEERRQLEAERQALAAQRESTAAPAARPQAAEPANGFGLEGRSRGESRLEARVVGTFNGWDGPTRFTLENGQVWETVGGVRWQPRAPVENAVVVIRRGMLNSYSVQMQGYNTRVQVRRIE